jgi:HD-GYP domain-containing protein (c-di-GMP phosphodiesterase class II)
MRESISKETASETLEKQTGRSRTPVFKRDPAQQITELTRIGIALSLEKNIQKLLEMIVDEARELTGADAGTLYILNREKQSLGFEIMQNLSMGTRMGGTSGIEIDLPDVPLYIGGRPNHSNVSSHVALTGKIVNISDVYEAEGFDFTGPRNYDASTGYRSKSMLVIPLQNHENDIIGVLQLLNAQHPSTGRIVSFSPADTDIVASLASQAAVALTNTQLIQNLQDLFYAFIKSIATAIDEKSPYTGGHINRVVTITMMIAQAINAADHGPFKDVCFTQDEMEELRLAAWMHDVGKITTPEYIVDKSHKLQTIFDRVQFIETRFNLIAQLIENNVLHQKLELERTHQATPARLENLDQVRQNRLKRLFADLAFIKECNSPDEPMNDEKIQRLREIGEQTFTVGPRTFSYLTADEIKNLSIRKGSLNAEERQIVENHAMVTLKILNQLPFPRKLARIPKYAAGHHEKLDGSGYPLRLKLEQLPLQTRIMAIADIFEALTAKDRPYKKPMKLSQAMDILSSLTKERHIDPDIYDLFVRQGIFQTYARREMNPDQIDDVCLPPRK